MCSSRWPWAGFRLEKLDDVTVRSLCAIHGKLWCLGRSVTAEKGQFLRKAKGIWRTVEWSDSSWSLERSQRASTGVCRQTYEGQESTSGMVNTDLPWANCA